MLVLIAISLLVGWFVPGFYEWTDSDQNRPSPLLWKIPLCFALVATAFCVALPWLPIEPKRLSESQDDPSQPRFRFRLRTLLGITTAMALILCLLSKFPMVVAGVLSFFTLVHAVVFWIRNPQHRLPLATLVACMVFPYVWILSYDELDRIAQALLWMLVGLPTFLPAIYVSSLLGQHHHDSYWLAILLTAAELAFGIWVIRLGPKRTIAYSLAVMLVSAMGSLGFYQLCIA